MDGGEVDAVVVFSGFDHDELGWEGPIGNSDDDWSECGCGVHQLGFEGGLNLLDVGDLLHEHCVSGHKEADSDTEGRHD